MKGYFPPVLAAAFVACAQKQVNKVEFLGEISAEENASNEETLKKRAAARKAKERAKRYKQMFEEAGCHELLRQSRTNPSTYHSAPPICHKGLEVGLVSGFRGWERILKTYSLEYLTDLANALNFNSAYTDIYVEEMNKLLDKADKGSRGIPPMGRPLTVEEVCGQVNQDYLRTIDRFSTFIQQYATKVEARSPQIKASERYQRAKADLVARIASTRREVFKCRRSRD